MRRQIDTVWSYQNLLTGSRLGGYNHGVKEKLVIRPVAQRGERGLFYVNPRTPDIAYLWSPRFQEKASGLVELTRLPMHFTFGAPVFFKPTFEEVLAQIPETQHSKVEAVEIPEQDIEFVVLDGRTYHQVQVKLYGKSARQVEDESVLAAKQLIRGLGAGRGVQPLFDVIDLIAGVQHKKYPQQPVFSGIRLRGRVRK